MCRYICTYVCMYVFMYVHTYVYMYACTYLLFVCVHAYIASRHIEELQKLDNQECPAVICSNIDEINLAFLLHPSGNLCYYFFSV